MLLTLRSSFVFFIFSFLNCNFVIVISKIYETFCAQGNTWAQTWTSLSSLVRPFPNVAKFDATEALKEQNYTVLKMFETSNEFYRSLGLEDCSVSFDVKAGAMIEKPDRDVLCHASAFDFCDGHDYR